VTRIAGVLGWNTKAYQFDGSPEDILEKFEFALEEGVDAIVTTGVARSSFETAAQLAIDQGVPIAACCIPDDVADPFTTVISNKETFYKVGQTLGAWVVADGGEDTHTAMAILAPFEVHVALGEGFVDEIERLCDSCSAEIIDSQIEDIGTNLPGLSVSILERNPEITHLMYADGVMATGVVAALRDSGLDDDVKIGGMNPGPADLQALIDGEHDAWLNLPVEWFTWMMVDSLARFFTGQEASIGMSAVMPGQLIDQNNVKGIEKPDGAIGQAEQFAALWGVG
jgi:ABC-type sugar transport system substrate-binding protein